MFWYNPDYLRGFGEMWSIVTKNSTKRDLYNLLSSLRQNLFKISFEKFQHPITSDTLYIININLLSTADELSLLLISMNY